MSWVDLLDITWQAVPALLYLFWALTTGAAALSLCPSSFSFKNAVQLSASRGKLWDSRPISALGPLSAWKVPQKWFAHFYFLGLLVGSLAISLAGVLQLRNKVWTIVTLSLLESHFLRRFLETVFLLHYPAEASMHGFAYVFGLAYYAVLPLTCFPIEAFRLPLRQLVLWSMFPKRVAANDHISLQLFCLGVVVFLGGMVLQFQSHSILAGLSKRPVQQAAANNEQLPDKTYKIPKGGAFELVSCPHYLGEIIIYTGLTLQLDLGTPLHWLPLCWVIANLILGANLTHEWYHRKFEDYPKQRRAIFPYLY